MAGTTDSIVDADGNRLGSDGGATMSWFLPDLHGNVAGQLSSDQATVTGATRYDPYGEAIETGTAGGTAVAPETWTYQGRLDINPPGLDPLLDMSARMYSPGLGAFTSLDSVMGAAQNPLSMNRFLYALGNPATLIDPTGHVPCPGWESDCKYIQANTLQQNQQKTIEAREEKDRKTEAAATYRKPSAANKAAAKTAAKLVPVVVRNTPQDEASADARETKRIASIMPAPSQISGWCGASQIEFGVMAGMSSCAIGGHVQTTVQIGASSGIGASVTTGPAFSSATSADQLTGWGAGYGSSVGAAVVGGVDFSHSISNGKTYTTRYVQVGPGFKASPEFATMAEVHAFVSFTIDIPGEVVRILADSIVQMPHGALGAFGP